MGIIVKNIETNMDLVVDRASKVYEPDQKVTGTLTFKDYRIQDVDGGAAGITMKAESYMDTVSAIRGKMGRPALEESKRIMFMTKKVEHTDDPKAPAKGGRLFEFSLLYKVYASFMIKHNQRRITVECQFYGNCPGRGVTLKNGRNLVPQEFKISHESLGDDATKGKIPKFNFDGNIFTTNCQFFEPFDGHIIKRNS